MTLEIIMIVVLFFLATTMYGAFRSAPWIPTGKKEIERFLEIAEIKKGEKIYDLGCGDGRILFASAKKGAEAKGLEIALFPFLLASLFRVFQKNRKNIKIIYRDIFRADFSDADIVYFFLLPKTYPKIKEKLEKEMKKGARVITFIWPVEGWTPVKVGKEEKRSNFYLYKI
jgi:SAM-dependent methyltransferase